MHTQSSKTVQPKSLSTNSYYYKTNMLFMARHTILLDQRCNQFSQDLILLLEDAVQNLISLSSSLQNEKNNCTVICF